MPKESTQGVYRLVRLENGKLRGVGDLRATIGSESFAVLQSVLSYFEHSATGNNLLASINSKLALMHALAPQNPLEGLLIAQMVTVHSIAQECLADGSSDKNLQGARLLTLFARQMEHLHRYRSQNRKQPRETIPDQLEADNGKSPVASMQSSNSVRSL